MSKAFLISLCFLAFSVIILSPFLFGGKVFLDSDVASYYYPIYDFYSKALKNNESFLWNPLLYSGFPSYVSQTAGFFDPLNRILFTILPSLFAYHLRLLIGVFLTLFFSYLAGRALGLSSLASSLIGLGYLSAFHWVYLSNIMVVNTLFLPSLLLIVLKKISISGFYKWLWAVAGGIGIGWAFIAGNAQITFYALFLFGIYALLDFFFVRESKKNLRAFLSFAGVISGIFFIGFLVGLPQILPSLEFTPLTTRSGGVDYGLSVVKAISPGNLLNFFFPDYLYFPYISDGRRPLYVGAFLFFMAVFGLIFARGKKEPAMLGSLFIFSLLASFQWSPLFYLLQHLPFFAYFRNPYKWMYLGVFFLAVSGAFGFDLIREYAGNPRVKRVFRILMVLVGVMAAGTLILNFLGRSSLEKAANLLDFIFSKTIYGHFGFVKSPIHYREALSNGLKAWQEFTSLADFYFLIPFLALVLSLAVSAAFVWKKINWRQFRAAGFLVAALGSGFALSGQFSNNISADLVLNSHQGILDKFIPSEDRALYRTYPFMLDRGFVEKIPPKFKLTLEENRAVTELRFAAGWPNTHFFANIPSVEGYDPLVPRELLKVLAEVGSTYSAEEETDALSEPEKVARLLKQVGVIGMMSGKYIISGVRLQSDDLRFLGEEKVSRFQIPIYLYGNQKALPRFYFAPKIVPKPGKLLIDLIKEGPTDFQENVYLDCGECASSAYYGPKKDEKPRLISSANGLFEFVVDISAPRWLIVSESSLPGWRAEIDGIEKAITRANGMYMGLEVPAGKHKVKLVFTPPLNVLRGLTVWPTRR